MGWSLGWDNRWRRDIGYGVPAWCDHPKCNEQIDRGLAYVCGNAPYGGEFGCGLFFCGDHMRYVSDNKSQVCPRCAHGKPPYKHPKPDHPEWIAWKLNDPSWAEWRAENPKFVALHGSPSVSDLSQTGPGGA